MSDYENPQGSASLLKQKLFEALRTSVVSSEEEGQNDVSLSGEAVSVDLPSADLPSADLPPVDLPVEKTDFLSPPVMEEITEEALPPELEASRERLTLELAAAQVQKVEPQSQKAQKTQNDDKLTIRGVVPDAQTEAYHPAGIPSSLSAKAHYVKSDSLNSGGSMADLSGYKDLSKAPISFGDEDVSVSSLSPEIGYERNQYQAQTQQFSAAQHFVQEAVPQEVDTEFSGNVKTLIRLVNELPEGVTKQTGAQIIRLTMEAMGISMEDVLSEAQSAQSEMLDAVRANIKKIEEYKTVIRKLETDIKYYQGKANELSEIIDLFILSNTTGAKMGMPEDMGH